MNAPFPQAQAHDQVLTDRDLLRRFLQDSDQEAFAQIVRRHQHLVMGVCRRILGDTADQDDAFQATFVSLARRPGSIRKAASLSSWLYSVAWRTSWKVLRSRRKHPVEQLNHAPVDVNTDSLAQIASAQDCVVLDEELNGLPGKYRDVLVMTYFQDLTSQQIADQLAVSKGTIDGRIRRARNTLRVRLARRGVSLGALAFAASLSSNSCQAATQNLLESTIHLGTESLSGNLSTGADYSVLEPFLLKETAMLTKALLTCTVCAGMTAGLFGMSAATQETPGQSSESRPPALKAEVVNASGNPTSTNPIATVQLVTDSDRPKDSSQSDPFKNQTEPADRTGQDRDLYKPYAADAKPSEIWMHGLMDKPIPTLDYPGEAPLKEILDQLADHFSTTYGDNEHKLNIWADKAELDVEAIELDDVLVTDIMLENVSLENALQLVFSQVTNPELTYEIKNEVFVITTKSAAYERLITKAYDVTKLLKLSYPGIQSSPASAGQGGGGGGFGGGGPSNEGGGVGAGTGGGLFSVPQMGMGGAMGITSGQGMRGVLNVNQPQSEIDNATTSSRSVVELEAAEGLQSLVMEMTRPPLIWSDIDPDFGGTIRIAGNTMIVRQTAAGHVEIAKLLNLLVRNTQ